ncbi:hypothetical protein Ahy_B05g076897 [Arachis hypogaea]|uniref:Oxo-4-hydroxy-4-carboxy-5-ureidoimidazoline decarboxylase domain-containing protein n=1 Tax=Arachis hypogaea TaxID=3818 RepID=A0A444Z474_ARAHY|nr:hypothetical protein Ahy_B05g076897 [Arachis hypogaea]
MKTEDFSSCCASTIFAKEMAMASPFSISVAKYIWFHKVNVKSWLEAISGRSFMRFTNKHAVELDIASQEKMKFIELHITELLFKKSAQSPNMGDVLVEYSGEIANDCLDGEETNSKDNLFDLNKILKEDNETLDNQQRQDDSWFGDDLSDPVSREGSRFLTEYFLPDQYDIEEKF